MGKKMSKLQIEEQKVNNYVKKVNQKIVELGDYTNNLYNSLNKIQTLFDGIRNVPDENRIKFNNLKKIQNNWRQQAKKIEMEYKNAEIKLAGKGVVGVGIGFAVINFGPTVAMGIATTFGVASTGTAISALNGVAAYNAALAWLGGGTLAVGGGGMAAGKAILGLAGPIGWSIAISSAVISGMVLFKNKEDKKRLENIYTLICNREIKQYRLVIVEINERIKKIDDETHNLEEAIKRIETFGMDYCKMSEKEQYELGAYVNLMEASTMLLTNPILGLQPKFTIEDFNKLIKEEKIFSKIYFNEHKNLVIYLANILFNIPLDEKDRKILAKSLRKNKEFLSSFNMSKKDFSVNDINMVKIALNHRYDFRRF